MGHRGKERQSRRKNIIVFGLPESNITKADARKADDIPKIVGLHKRYARSTLQKKI